MQKSLLFCRFHLVFSSSVAFRHGEVSLLESADTTCITSDDCRIQARSDGGTWIQAGLVGVN